MANQHVVRNLGRDFDRAKLALTMAKSLAIMVLQLSCIWSFQVWAQTFPFLRKWLKHRCIGQANLFQKEKTILLMLAGEYWQWIQRQKWWPLPPHCLELPTLGLQLLWQRIRKRAETPRIYWRQGNWSTKFRSEVKSLSHVWLSVTPSTVANQVLRP